MLSARQIRFGTGWRPGHSSCGDLHGVAGAHTTARRPDHLPANPGLPDPTGLPPTLPAARGGTRLQGGLQTRSPENRERWCSARSAVEKHPHRPQGACSASGKESPSPRAQPGAPGRGTTIPFSLGDSLCSTPAQSGGQCRYKGLFCPGADARERGRAAGAAVWGLGHR